MIMRDLNEGRCTVSDDWRTAEHSREEEIGVRLLTAVEVLERDEV